MTGSHSIRGLASVPCWWVGAALLVAALHSFPLKVAAILAVAYLCMRAGPWCVAIGDALLVGAAWVLLGIAAEVAVTLAGGRAWNGLLGGPNPLLVVAWGAAPLLFARRE